MAVLKLINVSSYNYYCIISLKITRSEFLALMVIIAKIPLKKIKYIIIVSKENILKWRDAAAKKANTSGV